MKFSSRLVEYFNGSSSEKNFDPGCSQCRLVQIKSGLHQPDVISWNHTKSTSKPTSLGNQLPSHPSGFCTISPPGITVISPLSKDMTGHKGREEPDQHLRSASPIPSPGCSIFLYSKLWPRDLVFDPDAGHVVVWRMIDGAEVRRSKGRWRSSS